MFKCNHEKKNKGEVRQRRKIECLSLKREGHALGNSLWRVQRALKTEVILRKQSLENKKIRKICDLAYCFHPDTIARDT